MPRPPADTVSVRFYAELIDLLPARKRRRHHEVELAEPRSVKDLIESFQVPHTEVDLILLNGAPCGFDALVGPGDRVAVYPVFEGLDIAAAQRLRPAPLRRPAFVCDVHLGTLARRMRLLGLDTRYDPALDDPGIVAVQAAEHRAILTCDRGLLQHNAVQWGYLVRSRDPDEQIQEVVHRFDLRRSLRPYTRCPRCNHLLQDATPGQVDRLAPPGVRTACEEFTYCPGCDRLYWPGTHRAGIERWIQPLLG